MQVMRGAKRKGVRYFGPYSHAWAIRETLDLLLRVFPVRTCSAGVFKRAGQVGRPCLLGYIGKCSAPCVGRVSAEEHRRIVEDFCDFMAGQTSTFLRRLEREMHDAAANQEYERAARLRDDIRRWSGPSRSRRSCSATAPTPTSSRSPRTSSRPRSRSSTSAAAGSAASAAGSSTRSRTSPPGPGRALPAAGVRRCRPGGAGGRLGRDRAARGPRPGAARRTPTPSRSGSPGCAAAGSTCGCRSAATSGP